VGALRRWLREWWDNPLFRQTDPDRIVPAARVPLWSWPMVRDRLVDAGIHVEAAEESRYPGGGGSIVPMTNIICRARDRDAVVAIVDEILDTDDGRGAEPGPSTNGSA
jgi:hypothetical protein